LELPLKVNAFETHSCQVFLFIFFSRLLGSRSLINQASQESKDRQPIGAKKMKFLKFVDRLSGQKRSVNVFAEFSKSIRRQVAENKEFQKNVQMLSDETSRLKESEAMQLAKGADIGQKRNH
jgi:hypothetical protein